MRLLIDQQTDGSECRNEYLERRRMSVALEYDELFCSRLGASDSDDMKALRVTRTRSRRVFQLTCVRAPTSGTGIRCPE